MPCYRTYGVTFSTLYPFVTPLPPTEGPADLAFRVVAMPPVTGWERGAPLFQSPRLLEDGRPRLFVYSGSGHHVLRFTDVADFYLWPDRIDCHLRDPDYELMIEVHLLGLVFSLWLALREVLVLHASAVAIGKQAVGFLASNRGGKTSLAATLSLGGHGILTDDLLAVRRSGDVFEAAPGFPQLRMWPDLAEHFVASADDLPLFHPAYDKLRVPVGETGLGSFCFDSQRLAVIYLPDRVEARNSIEIEPLSSAAASIELIQNTFGVLSVEALGLQRGRLGFISELLGQVAVRRVVFPSGLNLLPEVAAAIVADVVAISAGD